jgi:hypothetical protein
MRVKPNATKDDLLSLVAGDKVPGCQESRELPNVERGVAFVWFGEAESLPDLILVATEQERTDLLAWATTYLGPFLPLTSFCRVLLPREPIWEKAAPPQVKILSACTSLVIAEAYGLAGGAPTIRDCAATFSFVAARSILNDSSGELFGRVVDAYESVAKLARDHRRRDLQQQYLQAWCALAVVDRLSAHNVPVPKDVREACFQLWQTGGLRLTDLTTLAPKGVPLKWIDDIATMTMEDRVSRFAELSSDCLDRAPDRPATPFVLGYVLSRVSDGALRNVRVAARMEARRAGVFSWYALCAGLHPAASVTAGDDGAVGLRVARELRRPFQLTDAPRCDIAERELSILMNAHSFRGTGALRGLRNVSVELAPGIETRMMLGPASDPPKAAERQLQLEGVSDDEPQVSARLSELLQEALQLLPKKTSPSGPGSKRSRKK